MKVLEKEGEIADFLGKNREGKFTKTDDGLRYDKPAVAKSTVDLPEASVLEELAGMRGIKWREEYATRVLPYFASDERTDGEGDIVRQNWEFNIFEKNPVLPFSHQWGLPPVGNALLWDVVQRTDTDYQGPALSLLALFALGEQSEFAGEIFELADAGFLTAGSVGFQPLLVTIPESDEERQSMGLGRYGWEFTKSALLEFSPCTLPANSGAGVARSVKEKGLSAESITVLRELHRQEIYGTKNDKTKWLSIEANLVSIARQLHPTVETALHKDLDTPVVFGTGSDDAFQARQKMNEWKERCIELEARVEDLEAEAAKSAEPSPEPEPETASPELVAQLERITSKLQR